MRACPALAGLCGLLLLSPASAQNDPEGNFGPKVGLPLRGRAAGAVSGDGTNIYVSSHAGEVYLADIKGGKGKMLNAGGRGQTLGDLCLDSREGKTLYGTGRETGMLYAFDAEGGLERVFQVTDKSGSKQQHYISSCVQSRYWLWASDAFDDTLYQWALPDAGPERGRPPPLSAGNRDGTPVKLGGSWESAGKGSLGAISLEWSSVWNETGWVLNSGTGKIYNFAIDSDGTAQARRVFIDGKQRTFPGATKIQFDESNEHILYVAQPGRNAIAVIEINDIDPTQAMYIRTITSPLINSPVGMAQFGEWLYSVNGDFGAEDREDARYSLNQLPKHQQILSDDVDPDFKFSDVPEGEDPPQVLIWDKKTLTDYMTAEPAKTSKIAAPPKDETTRVPLVEETESNKTAPTTSGVEFGRDGDDDDDDDDACFPGAALVTLLNGEKRAMVDLKIGDVVEAAPGVFSPVYLFTHKDASATSAFVRIHHALDMGLALDATSGHYIYANGEMTAAGILSVGDALRTGAGEVSRVTRVERIPRMSGLFNPATVDGRIVVNGVVSSTYTTAVDPRAAEMLLAPFRMVAGTLGGAWNVLAGTCNVFDKGSRLSRFTPTGPLHL